MSAQIDSQNNYTSSFSTSPETRIVYILRTEGNFLNLRNCLQSLREQYDKSGNQYCLKKWMAIISYTPGGNNVAEKVKKFISQNPGAQVVLLENKEPHQLRPAWSALVSALPILQYMKQPLELVYLPADSIISSSFFRKIITRPSQNNEVLEAKMLRANRFSAASEYIEESNAGELLPSCFYTNLATAKQIVQQRVSVWQNSDIQLNKAANLCVALSRFIS